MPRIKDCPRLTYGEACFDGFKIVSLTKVEFEEPWSITDGDKGTNCFYHLFLLFIHNSYILAIICRVRRFKE
jgi:hypothetical protein